MVSYNSNLTIELLYLTRDVYSLEELLKNPNSYLKNLFENEESFLSFITEQNKRRKNIFELDGVLRIKYKNKDIIPLDCYDDISTLLIYFLNALEECAMNKTAEFYFPDQPLNVKIKLEENFVILTFEESEYKLDKNLFLKEFLNISKLFFELVVNKLNYKSYENELIRIENIHKIFNI